MARRRVIALVGIDGAGKTLLAKDLARWLTAQGVPAEYFENPGGRVAIDRFARRLGWQGAIDMLGRNVFVAVESTNRWFRIARGLAVSRFRRRTAVMDRYAYCQYAMIRARGYRGERFARLCYSVFPKPDLVCFITTPPEVAKARIDARGYDTEDLQYLYELDSGYRSLPEFKEFEVVDADATPEVAAARVRLVVTARVPTATAA
ncbi:dTMP kinase [Allorhizocola rhizosphaerae]|uniref:dTMP kinase n=1 Tax=Allorhizocola rhizosphaerae TaxID=1872709 RepID=UPI000E3E7621|nr:thymidylate kinase [Allorhizocola rhizosphaerae]